MTSKTQESVAPGLLHGAYMKKHGFLILLSLGIPAIIGQTAHAAMPAAPARLSDHNAIATVRNTSSSMLSQHADYSDGADHLLILNSSAIIPETPVRMETSQRKGLSKGSPSELGSNRSESGASGREMRLQGVSTWRSIGAVAFVLGGLLAASAYIRKRQGFGIGSGKQRSLKIIERLPFDSKRSIVLLEVEGRKLLVGAGTEHIEKLADLGMGDEFKEFYTADSSRAGIDGHSFRSADRVMSGLRVVHGGAEGI